MESENTVTYFLFNDRKGTSRCSFILICSLTFFNFYSCFTYILPLLYPNTALSYFICPSFSFSFHTYFIATPPPIRLLFALLHLNILPYINKKTSSFQFYSSPSRAHLQSFQPAFPPLFLFNSPPFPLVYLLLNPIQNSFSTPPQSLCTKGMATLSCNSYDIAPQKQCNCHLKALLLERKSYPFAPQRLCPQPTRA